MMIYCLTIVANIYYQLSLCMSLSTPCCTTLCYVPGYSTCGVHSCFIFVFGYSVNSVTRFFDSFLRGLVKKSGGYYLLVLKNKF